MQINKLFSGSCHVSITSADMASVLTAIQKENIIIDHVKYISELSVELILPRGNYRALKSVVDKKGGKIKLLRQTGLALTLRTVKNRPLFLCMILITLFLSVFLPTRVLFVRVAGNSSVPGRYILDEAQKCGISFGATRGVVRSEKVKNKLLGAIPELSWVGINTSGFVATISVKEKSIPQEPEISNNICSIVASRDGVIQEMTVIKGIGMCKTGQTVKAGQVLISGYEDLGILVRATTAAGEVEAQTLREIEVVTPVFTTYRGKEQVRQTKYSIIIGKKQINLYKDSGISDTSCVKICRVYNVQLPGDLSLPFCLIAEDWIYYDSNDIPVYEESFEWLPDQARDYLSSQMIAGSVLKENIQIQMIDDICLLTGQYACLEMIGQVRYEEIMTQYGKYS